jgi:putative transposase
MGFSPELKGNIMSYVKIWVHAVWGTKNREPILIKEIRKDLFQHIRENAKNKEIYIDFINGYVDHIHCLLALNADMSIAKAIQLIKGEAAFWANKNKLMKTRLEWADEYFAVSVSESMVDKVRNYIRNQEAHHKKSTFRQEYDEFVKKYKFVT